MGSLRLAVATLAALFVASPAPGQDYNIPFVPPPSGGTDFTADSGTGSNCLGAWLIYENGAAGETNSEADHCDAVGNQNGDDALSWIGAAWATTTPPTGTATGYDAVDITAGVQEMYQMANDNAFEAGDFTIGCWLNKDLGNSKGLISMNDTQNYEILVYDSGIVRGEVTTVTQNSPINTIADGTWSHIVLRYDGTNTDQVELFVDGVDACGGACAGSADPTGNADPFTIGGDQAKGKDLDGQIMECFYFDAALTLTEIREIMLCGIQGNADGTARDTAYGGSALCASIGTCC